MGRRHTRHNTLVAGLRIASGKAGSDGKTLEQIERGTLTGIATDLHTQRKVLVTCLHVMAGRDGDGSFRNPL